MVVALEDHHQEDDQPGLFLLNIAEKNLFVEWWWGGQPTVWMMAKEELWMTGSSWGAWEEVSPSIMVLQETEDLVDVNASGDTQELD